MCNTKPRASLACTNASRSRNMPGPSSNISRGAVVATLWLTLAPTPSMEMPSLTRGPHQHLSRLHGAVIDRCWSIGNDGVVHGAEHSPEQASAAYSPYK